MYVSQKIRGKAEIIENGHEEKEDNDNNSLFDEARG